MTDVLQCPYCELKFSSKADLDQHLAFDHPEHEAEEEEDRHPFFPLDPT
jgi:hypothetical protein